MAYFDLFSYVIMGNMKGLVTLVYLKIKSTNLASWGILMQIFQKVIYFQIQSFYDVSMTSYYVFFKVL